VIVGAPSSASAAMTCHRNSVSGELLTGRHPVGDLVELAGASASGPPVTLGRLSGVAAQGVVPGDFDEHDADAVGVGDPHLQQAPRLPERRAHNADT
jgi:hypothetical protein